MTATTMATNKDRCPNDRHFSGVKDTQPTDDTIPSYYPRLRVHFQRLRRYRRLERVTTGSLNPMKGMRTMHWRLEQRKYNIVKLTVRQGWES